MGLQALHFQQPQQRLLVVLVRDCVPRSFQGGRQSRLLTLDLLCQARTHAAGRGKLIELVLATREVPSADHAANLVGNSIPLATARGVGSLRGLDLLAKVEQSFLLADQIGGPLAINRRGIQLSLFQMRTSPFDKCFGQLLRQLLSTSMIANIGFLETLVGVFKPPTAKRKFDLFDSQEQHDSDHFV
jgi:hypothetical protein